MLVPWKGVLVWKVECDDVRSCALSGLVSRLNVSHENNRYTFGRPIGVFTITPVAR